MKNITASEIMTPDVLTVAGDLPVNRIVELLADHAISGVPVVSEEGKPIGIVSLTDLARSGKILEKSRDGEVPAYYREGLGRRVARDDMALLRVAEESATTARDVMTPMVFSVDATTPVQEVADAMIRGRIHRVLVTRAGAMVGIISSMDLLPLVRDM